MKTRFLLVLIFVNAPTQLLIAQNNVDDIESKLGAIARRLDTIEERLQVIEDDGSRALKAKPRAGIIPLLDVPVESLRPHVDALRRACDAPELSLGLDGMTNTLYFIAPLHDHNRIETAIRRWVNEAKAAETLMTIDDSSLPGPARHAPYLPSDQEILSRYVRLKTLFPERYRNLRLPTGHRLQQVESNQGQKGDFLYGFDNRTP